MRIKLTGALNGRRYCLAGAATEDNGWTIPGEKFTMQELRGERLIVLDDAEGGGLRLAKESNGEPRLTEPIAGFVSPAGEVRLYGNLDGVADPSGAVFVVFGTAALREEVDSVSVASLSEVRTPGTPSSLWSGKST